MPPPLTWRFDQPAMSPPAAQAHVATGRVLYPWSRLQTYRASGLDRPPL